MHAGQDATTELGVAWGHRAAEGGFEIYTNTSRRTRATRPQTRAQCLNMGVEFTSATPAIPNGAAPGPTRAANACAARGNLRMPETQTKNSSLPAPEKVFLFVKGALFQYVLFLR